MDTTPFFTILTAAYNAGNGISKTLESVCNQTFSDFEHIVVDGKSKDQTVDILKRYGSLYNLKWISEADTGIADALNKGLAMAQGRYIIVIQADDYFESKNVLAQAYRLLKDERFDIYTFPVFFEDPRKGRLLYKPKALWWYHFKMFCLHQGTFVHKRVFDQNGNFKREFSIAFDYDFMYRACVNKVSIMKKRLPVVAVMGGEGVSSSSKFLERRIREEFLVQKTNERSCFWIIIQRVYQMVYFPFKLKFLTLFKNS